MQSTCRALLAMLALSAAFSPALTFAAGIDCGKPVRERILELGIDPEDTNGMRFFTRSFAGRITGYDVWVRFHSCSGNLVIVLSNACFFRESYWRGDCPAEGMLKAPAGS